MIFLCVYVLTHYFFFVNISIYIIALILNQSYVYKKTIFGQLLLGLYTTSYYISHSTSYLMRKMDTSLHNMQMMILGLKSYPSIMAILYIIEKGKERLKKYSLDCFVQTKVEEMQCAG